MRQLHTARTAHLQQCRDDGSTYDKLSLGLLAVSLLFLPLQPSRHLPMRCAVLHRKVGQQLTEGIHLMERGEGEGVSSLRLTA